MLASDILDRVSMQLNDAARTRWSERMLLNYLTDAMRQTVLNRPDASAAVTVMKLEQGQQRQSIPEGMIMLLKVTRMPAHRYLSVPLTTTNMSAESVSAKLITVSSVQIRKS